tara:strand:+ start:121 stop:417 length:297 start_codon:yes stop_codon:yes gene_type:complete
VGKDTLKNLSIALIPVFLTVIGYLFNASMELNQKVDRLEQKMSILVDMDNQIIPSPNNAIQRMKLKEEVFQSQLELDKRLSILEHHVFTMIKDSPTNK